MAWFKSIQNIHHTMLQKDGRLALQIDVTATPRHDNGAIFVQTVSDYPPVEAIHQNVVKHPVLPDAASRAKLHEATSALFTEKYEDYLQLGIEEWRKSYAEQEELGKKAVLFVMVDDTRNCDDVGAYLELICPELQGAVLVIHTKNNGEISEAASGKSQEELALLREQSNEIDSWQSPYKAIVSVLVLKEGWVWRADAIEREGRRWLTDLSFGSTGHARVRRYLPSALDPVAAHRSKETLDRQRGDTHAARPER